MNPIHSRTAILYDQVRRALQSGQYLPGQRIDPTLLAAEFDTSDMPVRLALQRLVGAGLLEHHDRGSVYLPLPSEIELRGRYEWMQHLLAMACDIVATGRILSDTREIAITSADDDLVKLTWQLFDAIALATGHTLLHEAVKCCNDQLAPIRRAKFHLIDNPFDELVHLHRHWRHHDIPNLKAALHDYHERRKQLVPRFVASLKKQSISLN